MNALAKQRLSVAERMYPRVRQYLRSQPHPNPSLAAEGRTLDDYCRFLMNTKSIKAEKLISGCLADIQINRSKSS